MTNPFFFLPIIYYLSMFILFFSYLVIDLFYNFSCELPAPITSLAYRELVPNDNIIYKYIYK